MNKQDAKKKLQAAQDLIFEVENEMDLKTSQIRKIGYRARGVIGDFKFAIEEAEQENLKDFY